METPSYAYEGRKYLRAFDRFTRRINKPLTMKSMLAPLGSQRIDDLLDRVRWEFSLLILQIPYIGKKNVLKPRLLFSTLSLAFWRVLKHDGWKCEEISQFLIQTWGFFIETIPSFVRRLVRSHLFSNAHQRSILQGAIDSQLRIYKGDWIYKFIPGEKGFSYGMDVYHCAVVDFYKSQGAVDLLPFMCEFELKAASMLGFTLENPARLPAGARCCECRFVSNSR